MSGAFVDFPSTRWTARDFQTFSPLAKLLDVYVRTSPYRNIIGIYELTPRTISNDTGIGEDQLTALFKELSPAIMYDPDSCLVACFDYFQTQFLKSKNTSPNWIKAAEKNIHMLGNHPFTAKWLDRYKALNIPLVKGYEGDKKGFDKGHERDREGLGSGIGSTGIGKGNGQGLNRTTITFADIPVEKVLNDERN